MAAIPIDDRLCAGSHVRLIGSPAARLRDHPAEHVEGPGQRLGGVGEDRRSRGRDRAAGTLDHAARLLDRVLTEIGAADDLGHLREQLLDFV